MRIDKTSFAALREMFAERRPTDEVEAVFQPASARLERADAQRLLAYLQEPQKPPSAHDTLDVQVGAAAQGYGANGLGVTRVTVRGGERAIRAAMSGAGASPGERTVMVKTRLKVVSFLDYRLRVNMKREEPVSDGGTAAAAVAAALGGGPGAAPRTLRLKRRYSYPTSDGLFRTDVTAVRQLDVAAGARLPTYDRLLRAPERYEVELEYVGGSPDASAAKKASPPSKPEALALALLSNYSVLLKVIDDTDALLTPTEHRSVLEEYQRLLDASYDPASGPPLPQQPPQNAEGGGRRDGAKKEGKREEKRRIYLGPKPVTFEMRHLLLPPPPGEMSARERYTVTEKADGERRVLFVSSAGRAYTINERGAVRDTGLASRTAASCVLDGEHMPALSSFMCFDAYVVNGEDVRGLPLMLPPQDDAKKLKAKKKKGSGDPGRDRLTAARDLLASARFAGATGYSVSVKQFHYIAGGEDLFAQAKAVLANRGRFPYAIDGLVFTPADVPVPPRARTWHAVLKWKPPGANTIDFVVRLRDGGEEMRARTSPVDGRDAVYRVADLMVGYDLSWEPITALAFLSGERGAAHDPSGYVDRPFDVAGAGLNVAYLRVSDDGRLLCESGEEIVQGAVVEFSYLGGEPPKAHDPYGWSPLRTRQDKDSARGNDYDTALAVWQSVQVPVTEGIISGEVPPPPAEQVLAEAAASSVYYKRRLRSDEGVTTPMRSFHNFWVKGRSLLQKMSGARSLFDFGCAKAGDLGKWATMGRLERVVGVDLYGDNLSDPHNGAFMRVLQARQRRPPTAGLPARIAMMAMDASEPMDARQIEKMDDSTGDRQVARVLWGLVEPSAISSPRLRAYHGIAAGGFDVATCMFAAHYFFEDERRLRNFAANVARVLRPGGYFVGACLDGMRVDRLLAGSPSGTAEGRSQDGQLMWSISRAYTRELDAGAPANNYGLQVDVRMETIGQTLPEYLVDFRLLVAVMRDHGLEPLSGRACAALGLPESTGFFDGLFEQMVREHPAGPTAAHAPAPVQRALAMTAEEKRYSFLNRWFVFVLEG
jgi:SAM-dependent methyltransferase